MDNRQLNLADMDCVHYILDDVLGMNLMKLFVEARETSRQFWTSQTVQKYVRQVQRSFWRSQTECILILYSDSN